MINNLNDSGARNELNEFLKKDSQFSIRNKTYNSLAEAMLFYPEQFYLKFRELSELIQKNGFRDQELKYLVTPPTLRHYYYAFKCVQFVIGNGKSDLKNFCSLDLGCAYGLFVAFMQDNGASAYGIDSSEVAVKISRVLEIPHIQLGDVQVASSLFEQKFDVITCMGIPKKNYGSMILNSGKLIKMNGLLIFSHQEKEDYLPVLQEQGFSLIIDEIEGTSIAQKNS